MIYGPCPTEGCDGAPERTAVAHGGDIWECPGCGIMFQAVKGATR